MKTVMTCGVAAGTLLLGVVVGAAAPAHAYTVGQSCPGAQIGMRATDQANGQPIICDSDYSWHVYHGQVPHHRWADEQNNGY